jgi:hypothetical protein
MEQLGLEEVLDLVRYRVVGVVFQAHTGSDTGRQSAR